VTEIFPADVDGDGKDDFVIVHPDGKYTVHLFRNNYRRSGFIEKISDLETRTASGLIDISDVTVRDIDGDGKADLIVTRYTGELGFLESLKTEIKILIGTGDGKFSRVYSFLVYGLSVPPRFIDMNEDGAKDLLISRLATDILQKIIEIGIMGDVRVDYEFYQFKPERTDFIKEPVWVETKFVKARQIQERLLGSVPLVYVGGDHTGDGRPDMLTIEENRGQNVIYLRVFKGRRDSVFRGKPSIGFNTTADLEVKIDKFPRGVSFFDLNEDGIMDVVLQYRGSVTVVLWKY